MVLGSSPVAVTSPSDVAPASSKEFLDIQATIEWGFTLKSVRDTTRTYNLVLVLVHVIFGVFQIKLKSQNLIKETLLFP